MADKKKAVVKKVCDKVEHKNIYSALSAFQGELEPIDQSARVKFKTKAGEQVDFSYSPLGKIMETIYPLLAKNGLSVRHELGENFVEAVLTHETFEVINRDIKISNNSGTISIPENAFNPIIKNEIRSGKLMIDTKKSDMKDVGGQITYARRYTLGLVLGLATEEDKDTALFEQNKENLVAFAFRQAKGSIEKAKPEEMDKQIEYLNKELALALSFEEGSGEKAPAMGLTSAQYKELINIATAKKGGVKTIE